jgi:hypothetical protein
MAAASLALMMVGVVGAGFASGGMVVVVMEARPWSPSGDPLRKWARVVQFGWGR